jgi:tRNA(fMet)-specific endonuclease VapC
VAVGYLLDTNIVAAFFEQERDVLQRLSEVDYQIPFAVVAELYACAHSPTTRRERLENVRILLSYSPILRPDHITGERFGLLYAELTRQGRLIQINDIWIAALALQFGYTLVTRDSDFQRISGLKLERW